MREEKGTRGKPLKTTSNRAMVLKSIGTAINTTDIGIRT